MNPLALLADPTRQRILRLVWDREVGAGEIAEQFPVSFSAVSQHLALLRDAGLVIQRKEGRRRLYRADRERLGPLAAALEAMWADQLLALRDLAEAEQREIDAARGERKSRDGKGGGGAKEASHAGVRRRRGPRSR